MPDGSAQDARTQTPHALALRLIAAAQRRAGLDGSMLLTEKDLKFHFVPLDRLDDFIAEGAVDLEGVSVDTWLYEHSKFDLAPRTKGVAYPPEVGTAVLSLEVEAKDIYAEFSDLDEDKAKETAAKNIEAKYNTVKERLTEHMSALRKVGTLAYLFDTGIKQYKNAFEASLSLIALFILEKAIPFGDGDNPEFNNDPTFKAAFNLVNLESPPENGGDYEALMPGAAYLDQLELPLLSLDEIAKLLPPQALNETPEDVAKRLAMDPSRLDALVKLWEGIGRNERIFKMSIPRAYVGRRSGNESTWLVDGIIPNGSITLFIGKMESGKSTVLHDLALKTGLPLSENPADAPHWLGIPINQRGNYAVFLSGEDPTNALNDRAEILEPSGLSRVIEVTLPGTIQDHIDWIKKLPALDLFIVDPMRPFLEGSVISDENINNFMTALKTLAEEKDCAVIVVCHTKRDARMVRAHHAKHEITGAQVLLDRPRAAWGISMKSTKAGPEFEIGYVKGNLNGLIREPMWFRSDPTTRQLIPLKANAERGSPDEQAGNAEDRERVLIAIQRLIGDGVKLSRTGRKSLYYKHPSEIDGMSRDTITQHVDALANAGIISVVKGRICLTDPNVAEKTTLPADTEVLR